MSRRARIGQRDEHGVFLTGATGFLGMELLARYLERTDRRVFALVRGANSRQAAERIERTLLCLFGPRHPYGARVVPVRGDLTRPGLGMGRRRQEVAEQVDEIVHSAATVSFSLGLEESREINVEGTRRVLEFGSLCQARGGLRRLSHVSTAYVAGRHSGQFSEDDLSVGQRFRNSYERSKFEAECLVQSWREQLPLTVMRPSIIVGEQQTGWTVAFNVLYWPLRAYSRGAYSMLPARGGAAVDVVPVDYVADAVFALSQAAEAEDGTFNLTAGRDASSVGELIELASSFFRRPPPRLLEPAVYRRVVHPMLLRTARDERFRRALKDSELFFPYFTVSTRYDDRRARATLHSTGIRPAPLSEYFDRLVRFAIAAEWGRREIPRASANTAVATTRRRSGARARQVQAELVPA